MTPTQPRRGDDAAGGVSSRWLVTAGRALAGLALLSVSSYYLLASIPFANYHFLQFAHFWWLRPFINAHAAIMAAGVLLLGASLPAVPWTLRRRLVLAALPFAAWMLAATLVPAAQSYESAAALCFAPLAILAVAGVLDLRSTKLASPELPATRPASVRALLLPSIAGAVLCASVYLAQAAAGLRGQTNRYTAAEILLIVVLAGVGHVLALMTPLSVWLGARAFGRRVSSSPWGELVTATAGAAVIIAVLVYRVVLSTLLVGERYALVLAAALGVAVSIYWIALLHAHHASVASSRSVRLQSDDSDDRGRQWQELTWWPVQPGRDWQWWAFGFGVAGLVLSVAVLPRLLLLADWGMAMQKTLVITAWGSAITIFRAVAARARLRAALLGVTGVVAGAIVTTAVTAAPPRPPQRVIRGAAGLEITLQRFATLDSSMATILNLLRPALTDREFFDHVRTEGDRSDTQDSRAVPLVAAPENSVRPAYRPHIFMIVVDSLRPDYLGAYNPDAAAFSPAITAFAREAAVLNNAFTPYAGTALSQPAIWAGGLIPRLNYVQPFSALNSLERLLEQGDYRRYISMDDISRSTLTRQDTIRNLDTRPEQREDLLRFDLCATLPELITQFDRDGIVRRDGSDPRPVFAYTRPLNVHIRVLASEFPKYEGVRYGATDFFKPAAAGVERLDGCFGTFIAALKARGLYEDSIIVVTADHGDSYGEDGRWGHAYYLMPETLRVPLIIRMPARLADAHSWPTDTVAMTTDITPTLVDLLGYGYRPVTPLAGRSLARAASNDDPILVQSSYSRAYGLLDRHGKWLYAVNANQLTESLYELAQDRATEVIIDGDARSRLRAGLLAQLAALNAHYVSR